MDKKHERLRPDTSVDISRKNSQAKPRCTYPPPAPPCGIQTVARLTVLLSPNPDIRPYEPPPENPGLLITETLKPGTAGFFIQPSSCRRKKRKKIKKPSCGFFSDRIDHSHRRGGHDPMTRRAISSVGRAPRLHRGCREFESLIAHHSPKMLLFIHRFFLLLSHRVFLPLKLRHFEFPCCSPDALERLLSCGVCQPEQCRFVRFSCLTNRTEP